MSSLKEKTFAVFAKLFAPKLIRNLLAAAGGWFASEGIAVDGTSTLSILTGLFLYLLAAGWSWWTKTTIDQSTAEKLKQFAEALASQAIAAAAGWLQQLGYTGSIDDTAGLALFGLNLGLSTLSRPDKPKPPIEGRPISQRPGGITPHDIGNGPGKF